MAAKVAVFWGINGTIKARMQLPISD